MYKVKIWIMGMGEWEAEIDIESEKSLRAAKNKATQWISKNLFRSDYDRIDKEQITRKRADWYII